MPEAKRDGNNIPVIQGVDSTLFVTPTDASVNPITHELLVTTGFGIPTSGSNPSRALSYDGVGNLEYITKTINSVDYRKTLSYDGVGNLTDISKWIKY